MNTKSKQQEDSRLIRPNDTLATLPSSSSFSESRDGEEPVCPVRMQVVAQILGLDTELDEKRKAHKIPPRREESVGNGTTRPAPGKPLQGSPSSFAPEVISSLVEEDQLTLPENTNESCSAQENIPPPASDRLVREQAIDFATPGAFSVTPSLLGNNLSEQHRLIPMRLEPESLQLLDDEPGSSGRAVDSEDASILERSQDMSLPRATLVDLDTCEQGVVRQRAVPEEESSKEMAAALNTSKRNPFPWMVCACVLGILFLLALGISLGAVNSREAGSSAMEPIKIGTTTTVPMDMEQYVINLLPIKTRRKIRAGTDNTNHNPQAMAFQWLLQDPHVETYSDARLIQRYALAAFYYATDGQAWVEKDNWLSYIHNECEWYRSDLDTILIDPLDTSIKTRYFVDYPDSKDPCESLKLEEDPEEGILRHIWLVANNLRGVIPDELYLLTKLETITVSSNHLEGTISKKLGLLTDLVTAVFHANHLTGSVPTELGLLSKLSGIFSFSNRDLGGPIPSELGQLKQLQFALMMDSELTGTIPTELGQWTNLSFFNVDNNVLTGAIPSELGKLTMVNMLSCGNNHLEGPIPTEFGQLGNLLWIHLHDNSLTSSIPSELARMTSSGGWHFNNNQLTGTIPEEVEILYKENESFYRLNLANNLLSGTIPEGLCSGMDLMFDCSSKLCGCNCTCSDVAP